MVYTLRLYQRIFGGKPWSEDDVIMECTFQLPFVPYPSMTIAYQGDHIELNDTKLIYEVETGEFYCDLAPDGQRIEWTGNESTLTKHEVVADYVSTGWSVKEGRGL